MNKKNFFHKIYKIVILSLLISFYFLFINRLLLNLFNLDYRLWLNHMFLIITIILLVIFIVQSIIFLIIKILNLIKKKLFLKSLLYICTTIILILSLLYAFSIIAIFSIFELNVNEELINQNNKKIIIESFSLKDTVYNYYEYKNFLFKSKEEIFTEST